MNREKGNALASLLVAVAIIAILVVISMYGGWGPRKTDRKDGLGKTTQGAVRAQALDLECQSDLSQIRQTIQLRATEEDRLPASLEELRLPPSLLKCPIGGEAYKYDPATGKVECPHPGHEKL